MGEPLRVGVVGCGNISDQYLTTLRDLSDVRVVAVTDHDTAKATRAAALCGTDAVAPSAIHELAEIEWILNLTTPVHHREVALEAIAHGHGVYNEKPLCDSVAGAGEVIAAARAAGVGLACAPDTVLGTGIQTARAVVDAGEIGRPVAATATMAVPGHEAWHPAPDFYYAPGGGPLLDMGPYYLTALVTLLGPVTGVYGAGSRTRDERIIGSGPRAGARFPVTVDTHTTAILEHASGALTTLLVSFDAAATRSPNLELHGEAGSLVVPDPNRFDGDVFMHRTGQQWELVPPRAGYSGAGRGCGLADIARSPDRRTARASAELAFHVLDVMESVLTSAATSERLDITSTCTVPPPVPLTRLPKNNT